MSDFKHANSTASRLLDVLLDVPPDCIKGYSHSILSGLLDRKMCRYYSFQKVVKSSNLTHDILADVAELVHAADCKSADERSNRSFGSLGFLVLGFGFLVL